MMVAAKKNQPKKATLPVNPEVRELADEVMKLGDYGTLTNTLKVSLRYQKERLEQQQQHGAAAGQS